MGINYAAADLIERFTVNEAAMLWCDVGRITEEYFPQFLVIQSAIVQAIKSKKLKAVEIPIKMVEQKIRGGVYDIPEPDYEKAVISRNSLKKWAERNNQKPKFLFAAERGKDDVLFSGTTITQVNITADNVVVAPKQKPEPRQTKSKPVSTSRESEMHKLIERVYNALCKELNSEPSSKQIMNALENRQDEFDKNEIIQDIDGDTILWVSARGHEQRMKLTTLQNIVSKIRSSKK